MKIDVRERIAEEFFDLEREIARGKGAEYASEEDTLQNFKIIADILNITMPLERKCRCGETVSFTIDPLMVLAVYLLKHILAMLDYMGRKKSLSAESIKDRVLDTRVYSFLAYCLTKDLEL